MCLTDTIEKSADNKLILLLWPSAWIDVDFDSGPGEPKVNIHFGFCSFLVSLFWLVDKGDKVWWIIYGLTSKQNLPYCLCKAQSKIYKNSEVSLYIPAGLKFHYRMEAILQHAGPAQCLAFRYQSINLLIEILTNIKMYVKKINNVLVPPMERYTQRIKYAR